MFNIELFDLTNTPYPLPNSISASVLRYSEKAIGGSTNAEIFLSGDDDSLAQALNWLKFGIQIRNEFGTVVWRGFISGLDISTSELWDRVSLDNMYNTISVTYSDNNERKTTSTGVNTASYNRYGKKEISISIGDATEVLAEAKRDDFVDKLGKPVALPLIDNASYGVTLFCSGQWELLDWVNFQRLEGRIENIADSTTNKFPIGWKVSASNQINFYGVNTNDNKLVYGKKITDATNATPIVITCGSHGYANNDLVYINNVKGNTAANGTFKIANVTTNTFELKNPNTNASIAGTGAYTSGGTVTLTSLTGIFDGLAEGLTFIVSGSVSNNTTFTTNSNNLQHAREIDILPVPTQEFAGSSVTIQLVGEQIAQSFLGNDNFSANDIAIKISKIGSPSDNVTIELRNDSAGSVGGTILGYATIPNSEIGTSSGWIWKTLNTSVSLSDGTRYWIVIKRSGTANATDYYNVDLSDTTYETMKYYNGSSWITNGTGQSIPFKVWAVEDVAQQIERIISDCGDDTLSFSSVTVPSSHGVKTNQYQNGDRKCLDIVEDLLATIGSSGKRLLAKVTALNAVKVYTEPSSSEEDDILGKNKTLLTASNQQYENGVLPVGKWLRRHGLPIGSDIMIQRNVFVEEMVFDAKNNKISQLRTKGSEDFF